MTSTPVPARAVILGSGDSMFPRILANDWRRRGLDVSIVCHERVPACVERSDVPIVSAAPKDRSRRALHAVGRTLLGRSRRSGGSARTVAGPQPLAAIVANGWNASRAAMAQKPDFVFGMEVYQYGFATSLCRGVTRILHPWGYDIREYSESAAAFRLVRWSLAQAHLVVPGSFEAADYIRRRFQIADGRVVPAMFGQDLERFHAADSVERRRLFEEFRIGPDRLVVSNVRRGRCDWGFEVALESFARLATERPNTHFILLGDSGAHGTAAAARVRQVAEACGARERFTCFDAEIPFETFARLMSVTDVFVSLPQFTDMRSASVLQAAASGGTPVVADQPEFRRMVAEGFHGLLVDPRNVDAVTDAVRTALSSESLRRDIARANRRYTDSHSIPNTSMTRLLDLIAAACQRRVQSTPHR